MSKQEFGPQQEAAMQRAISEKVPLQNEEILAVLQKESEMVLAKHLQENIENEENSKIGLERITIRKENDLEIEEEYITAFVWNQRGELLDAFNITTKADDSSSFYLTPETYGELLDLCTDIDGIRRDVSESDDNNIF